METPAEKLSEVRLGSCFPLTSHLEILPSKRAFTGRSSVCVFGRYSLICLCLSSWPLHRGERRWGSVEIRGCAFGCLAVFPKVAMLSWSDQILPRHKDGLKIFVPFYSLQDLTYIWHRWRLGNKSRLMLRIQVGVTGDKVASSLPKHHALLTFENMVTSWAEHQGPKNFRISVGIV